MQYCRNNLIDKVKELFKIYNTNEDSNKLLSSILIGNNVVNIAATSISTALFTSLIPGASGVAIATALMPPLCTVGYGLATGKLSFAVGAMYLFMIKKIKRKHQQRSFQWKQ